MILPDIVSRITTEYNWAFANSMQYAACVYYYISFLHARNKCRQNVWLYVIFIVDITRQKCMLLCFSSGGDVYWKLFLQMGEYLFWLLSRDRAVVIAVNLGQSWDAVAVNSPSYLLSHHSCFRIGSLWCIYLFIDIYIHIFFKLYIYIRATSYDFLPRDFLHVFFPGLPFRRW